MVQGSKKNKTRTSKQNKTIGMGCCCFNSTFRRASFCIWLFLVGSWLFLWSRRPNCFGELAALGPGHCDASVASGVFSSALPSLALMGEAYAEAYSRSWVWGKWGQGSFLCPASLCVMTVCGGAAFLSFHMYHQVKMLGSSDHMKRHCVLFKG